MKRKNPAKKFATLTAAEQRAWTMYYTSLLTEKKTPAQADRLAWMVLQTEFKRLKKFAGIGA